MKYIKLLFLGFILALSLSPVSTGASPKAKPVLEEKDYKNSDPLEPINREIFILNQSIDYFLLRPIAVLYRDAVPEWGRDRVSNVVTNLKMPVYFANSIFQGDVRNAFATFWAFVINSTFGIGGIFDQAHYAGLKYKEKDFGQTLGYYGIGSGAYLILPLYGSSTIRDTVGLAGDMFLEPLNYAEFPVTIAYTGTKTLVKREKYLNITDDIDRTSFDAYATYRSLYLQRREKDIKESR